MLPTDGALLALGNALKALGYRFTTVTPESHRRVLSRNPRQARNLRDVFGWNQAFIPSLLPPHIWQLLTAAEALKRDGDAWRSTVRFSSLDGDLFVHSAYPTAARDAVFFGPDTYRFATFLARQAPSSRRVVDVGCGSGAGGIRLRDRAAQITLCDINPLALRYASINAALNEASHVEIRHSDILQGVREPVDLIVANPPYIVDERDRLYCNGGGPRGTDLALRIVRESLEKLTLGGQLLLYTGTPIVDGVDVFWHAAAPSLRAEGLQVDYGEIDPDVFGEELDNPCYADVDRLAAVWLQVQRRA